MTNKKIRAGIIGGAGYTGGELIRILLNHPSVSISFIHSRSNAGKLLSAVHQDLVGDTELVFTGELTGLTDGNTDVIFLCVGHGEAMKFLVENKVHPATKIIDLSQDFRLKKGSSFNERNFVYGLPELNRDKIASADNIANPGCFATALQLGLLPLAKEKMLSEVYTTGITGSTGAGQSLSPTSHFSWRANNIQAYKTLSHQHLNEIHESVSQLHAEAGSIHFVPWRGDFTRGIFVSSTIHSDLSLAEITTLYKSYYEGHPFTILSNEISLKQVVNTNKCLIGIEKAGSKLVIHSAIDNLLKGASGQAVQNMNIMFGLDETTGLKLKATAF
jgi:N-acetyl-gamma-glutamyl-phosphate reductase